MCESRYAYLICINNDNYSTIIDENRKAEWIGHLKDDFSIL